MSDGDHILDEFNHDTLIPDGGELFGEYKGNVLIEGSVKLTGHALIEGDLIIQGSIEALDHFDGTYEIVVNGAVYTGANVQGRKELIKALQEQVDVRKKALEFLAEKPGYEIVWSVEGEPMGMTNVAKPNRLVTASQVTISIGGTPIAKFADVTFEVHRGKPSKKRKR